MKCPKCGYIGFEQTERCRNCGYDFVLSVSSPDNSDLPLRKDEAAPFGDFDLGAGRAAAAEGTTGARRRYDPDLEPRVTPQARVPAPDLPLFEDFPPEELPIVPAAAPTPPLAVRRSAPPAARARARTTPRIVEPAADSGLPLTDGTFAVPPGSSLPAAVEGSGVGLGQRVLAGLLDWLLVLGADAVVIYFTLKICRLAPGEFALLPLPPLAAFLVLVDGGYFAMLTAAGGQTLGKMAFKLRVIGADDRPLTVARAILRAVALLAATLPAGLGLVPAIFSAGHRGLHDWLAGTQVVRADDV
jgi:uncharacterized RDD family membrane protein YckC